MKTMAYKTFTHDLRSPIQGGDPVWNGQLPYQLPKVEVDQGECDCAAGWNACRTPEDALVIAGLWPDGWPSRLFAVETDQPVVERGDKLRASTWTVTEEITDFRPLVAKLTERFNVGDLVPGLVGEQLAWREALVRPKLDQGQVEAGLRRALEARGLDWQLRLYAKAWDAWAAWAARAAWAIWDTRDAWDARAARAARAAWDAWAAWAAWDAWAARAALFVWVAARKGLVSYSHDYLTVGIRDAYRHGLAIALPVEDDVLGWATVEKRG